MNLTAGQFYLESYLAPLASWLNRSDITDIYINRPGEIWTETVGGMIEQHEVPELDRTALQRLARQVAAANAQGINRESPLLAGSLPDGSRIQLVLPPATRGEVAVAIRRHVVQDLALESYRPPLAGSVGKAESTNKLSPNAAPEDPIAMLRQAVKDRRNILISGGTSSGKTTFLNTLLREVPSNERLILIEDAAELQLRHANAVGLIATRGGQGEADVTVEDLLIAALRMRPDRIILGEIRGSEAITFLRAVNTGHPGSITTIHADSPERAIDQLVLLTLQAGSRLGWDDAVHYIRNSIDIVVHLKRENGMRTISAVKLG